jgi:hypothetical protein
VIHAPDLGTALGARSGRVEDARIRGSSGQRCFEDEHIPFGVGIGVGIGVGLARAGHRQDKGQQQKVSEHRNPSEQQTQTILFRSNKSCRAAAQWAGPAISVCIVGDTELSRCGSL